MASNLFLRKYACWMQERKPCGAKDGEGGMLVCGFVTKWGWLYMVGWPTVILAPILRGRAIHAPPCVALSLCRDGCGRNTTLCMVCQQAILAGPLLGHGRVALMLFVQHELKCVPLDYLHPWSGSACISCHGCGRQGGGLGTGNSRVW